MFADGGCDGGDVIAPEDLERFRRWSAGAEADADARRWARRRRQLTGEPIAWVSVPPASDLTRAAESRRRQLAELAARKDADDRRRAAR